ncbi:hypothetical protein CO173_03135 [Candidatus Uhrbacteria bacterium CG_4_9_14_3_um_filter_41_35]|uniref:SH3b domain-containing protein n=1 Tax=Candidatus Uhrbacteria bacterium CG_4_9_14_3_um_filter_41_35 TaxID=1975034 RepID=A0A2M7XEM8_9BACT|nr:MAG: hypothetical protein COV92_00730 [Candidatus Uhrbacteria bacterium CG11_big_fil_rev_8_21_14_0_20_41_9]PJA46328.1 MAG: hypothetical protein CO173_03135 [Candidatus Uhrbacteria bacterium CG_4_9_14_3_um_filter_41_35]
MKRTAVFLTVILTISSLGHPQNAKATDCFNDPIIDHNWIGTVTTGVRVRDVACMDGSAVVTTLPVGESLTITGETDGWWRVKTANGLEGWAGSWLIEVTDQTQGFTATEPIETQTQTQTQTNALVKPKTSVNLTERLRGHILLQVENHGEAWYVHPTENTRYYMKDGNTAYEMMRKFGLGITNSDLVKLQTGDQSLLARLRGQIVLQVENHGEAFYIHPTENKITYLKDGETAYTVMREQSLGITNADLEKITSSEFTALSYNTQTTSNTTTSTTQTDLNISTVPSNIDLDYINTYWQNRVNNLRVEKGLRELTVDNRWIGTATKYAEYMGENDLSNHERADGATMHQWIDQQGLDFTERYTTGGWQTNYFTENITWGYTDNSNEGLIQVLEDTMGFFLSEASYNGAHYRTIYHADWNSLGSGFYFKDLGNGQYKVSAVFHYGSLKM